MSSDKPTIGLTMIGGGSAFQDGGQGPGDLALCLESTRPARFDQIVIVDTGLGVEGRSVVGAESQVRQQGGLPPIEMPSFAWCDDFAAARNHSLSLIKTSWFMWIDHDDWVEGAEHIRSLVESVHDDPQYGFFWLPYRYSFDEYHNCTTLHDRERLLRRSCEWQWKRRVHETLEPKKPVNWIRDTSVILNHMRGGESHVARNIPLLLQMIEEDPSDIRAWKDMANQYVAGGEWEKATTWYDKFIADARGGRMERYQAMTYAARAYREIGDWSKALMRDNQALLLIPSWNDAYFGLGQSYASVGEWEKAVHWAEESRRREVPSRYIFLNPLECQVLPCEILSIAYAGLERFDEAIDECDKYLEVRPNERKIIEQRASWVQLQAAQKTRQAFLGAVPLFTDAETVAIAGRLNGAGDHGAVRDILMPTIMREARRGTQPEVTFFCGPSPEEWYPGTPKERGIGGSETACIEIAKRFAAEGWRTWVFNRCGLQEGMHDGVGYMDYRRWRPSDKSDLLVSWRQPGVSMEDLGAQEKWLWLHNLYVGRMNKETAVGWDRIFGVSQWHADAMQRVFPFVTDTQAGYLPNGINLERFDVEGIERNPYKLVWMSSPDRGLKPLLQMWPEIYKRNSLAELHIFYGWENIDYEIRRGDKRLYDLKRDILGNGIQPGIQWRGRVDQDTLARELLSAQMWAYPAYFQEEFCIAALEAMAAGLFIVTSDMGALPDTLGAVGYKVPVTEKSRPTQKKWRDKFLGVMFAGLYAEEFQGQFRESGPARAAMFSWNNVFKEHWLSKVLELVRV